MKSDNELLIDFDVFDERIADFENSVESFEMIFNKIINLLNTMTKNEWQGDSAEAFEKKTSNLIAAMNTNKDLVHDYISDLQLIKAEFSDMEDKIRIRTSVLDDVL